MAVSASKVELELSTWVNGREWHLYEFHYNTPDGTFAGYLHAISDEHAAAMLSELKDTAVISGQLVGVYDE